jgi:hypothetical protein
MKISDVRLVENGDGGDFVLIGNDTQLIDGFQNMPYIGLFGGNLQANTTGPKVSEQSFDYWGNFMFAPTNQVIWFNSDTERILNNIPLSSETRILIESQVKKDLQFIQTFATVNASVVLLGNHRIGIEIQLIEPNTNQITEFSYIWDAMQGELISDSNGNGNNPQITDVGLDYGLDFSL